jgi:hypothetical protein
MEDLPEARRIGGLGRARNGSGCLKGDEGCR